MSLDIGDALRDGASRTVALTGFLLMAGFVTLGLVSLVVRQSFLVWYFEQVAAMAEMPPSFEQPALPLALALPPALAVVLWLVSALVSEAFRIVAVRTMVGDYTDTIPADLLTRNIGLATLNGFVGGIVVGVLVTIGGVFLLVPGIFLALSFVFVRQEIAVEDVNFVDAMTNSWELSSGNRVELAVLGIVWLTLALVAFGANVAITAVFPEGSLVTPFLTLFLSAPVTVFVVATAARAYVQLKAAAGEGDADLAGEDGGTDDEEEWPDPPGVDI